jgi:hypothetical protein
MKLLLDRFTVEYSIDATGFPSRLAYRRGQQCVRAGTGDHRKCSAANESPGLPREVAL